MRGKKSGFCEIEQSGGNGGSVGTTEAVAVVWQPCLPIYGGRPVKPHFV